jgi:hypothetical protein
MEAEVDNATRGVETQSSATSFTYVPEKTTAPHAVYHLTS